MKHLSTIARIITPLAMVVFLAYEINRSMAVDGYWAIALLIGAIGTAVGIEIVGILAGHALEGYWNLGDKNRATLSFVLLAAYTITAVYILRHNQAMVLVPVIAAIVYLLASLTTNLETTMDNRKDNEAEIKAFNREQAKADRDLERELKRQKQADETAVKLARVEAKAMEIKAKAQTETPKARETHTETKVNIDELSGNKLEIYNLFRENPKASNTEIAESVGVSRQYVGQIRKELNGAIKEAS